MDFSNRVSRHFSGGLARPFPAASLSWLLVCLAFLSGCGVSGESSAACGQSAPEVEPSRVAPGETFRLRGGGFQDGCNDTGPPFLPEPPRRDIRIEMRQEGKTWTLASGLAAGGRPDYALDVELKVPNNAEPGEAVVAIPNPNSAEPLRVPFRVLDSGPG